VALGCLRGRFLVVGATVEGFGVGWKRAKTAVLGCFWLFFAFLRL